MEKIHLKDYQPNLNDFWSADIEKIYGSIMSSSKKELIGQILDSMEIYNELLSKSLEGTKLNFDEKCALENNKIFYEVAVDRLEKSLGVRTSLPAKLEVLLN